MFLALAVGFSGGCVLATHPGLWSPTEKKYWNEEEPVEVPSKIALVTFYTESGNFYGPGRSSRHYNEMPGLYYLYGALQLLTLGTILPYAEPLFVTWDKNDKMPPLVLHIDSYILQGFGTELRRHGIEVKLFTPEGYFRSRPMEILKYLNDNGGDFGGIMIVRVSYNQRIRMGFMYHLKSILVDSKGREVFSYYFMYRNPDIPVWGLGEGSAGYQFEDGLVEKTEGTRMMNTARDLLMRDFSGFLELYAQIHKPGRKE
jgi:hypothetical protein